MNIYEYIAMIQKKPWLYLWENSIRLLRVDLYAYYLYPYYNNIDIVREQPPFNLLHDYIALVHNIEQQWPKWWSLILIEKYWDTLEALDKFFEHLDDFKELFWPMTQEEMIAYFDQRWYDVRSRFE